MIRGRCKYKGKLPLKWLNCKKIGHIESRCPNTNKNDKKDKRKTYSKILETKMTKEKAHVICNLVEEKMIMIPMT